MGRLAWTVVGGGLLLAGAAASLPWGWAEGYAVLLALDVGVQVVGLRG